MNTEELRSLVVRALAADLDAYGEIVRRFQDMAYGYAYSILGDLHLAEDAAQKAMSVTACGIRTKESFGGTGKKSSKKTENSLAFSTVVVR